ncbi:MAG: pyridoxamine 5'-phosphate oxidase [Paracoccaceae bacterium]
MAQRDGIFAGDDPFRIAQRWLDEAWLSEPQDANAAALATVDADGMPDVRIVLIKAIGEDDFEFFTNYASRKGQQIATSGKAAFNIHWKTLGRQIRVRGSVSRLSGAASDAYFGSRPLGSRIGAWASRQSETLKSKATLVRAVQLAEAEHGDDPVRPEHWGGYVITPYEIEFWAQGEYRLHDRFRWQRKNPTAGWDVNRLNP